MTPPPLPASHRPTPPQPPPSASPKKSNTSLWIILSVVIGLFVIGGIGIVAAVFIPTVSKVRATARRMVDQTSLREIGRSSMLWSIEHDGALPPLQINANGEPIVGKQATIHAVAAALARDGGLNDASMWFARDQLRTDANPSKILVVAPDGSKKIDPAFAQRHGFAWDFATGLTTSMSPMTPVAWTRGLRTDGTWDRSAGVYGSDGGYIVFLGGNVHFHRDLRAQGGALLSPGGTLTANILETLPAGVRVVGDGPGTLDGKTGLAPAR